MGMRPDRARVVHLEQDIHVAEDVPLAAGLLQRQQIDRALPEQVRAAEAEVVLYDGLGDLQRAAAVAVDGFEHADVRILQVKNRVAVTLGGVNTVHPHKGEAIDALLKERAEIGEEHPDHVNAVGFHVCKSEIFHRQAAQGVIRWDRLRRRAATEKDRKRGGK